MRKKSSNQIIIFTISLFLLGGIAVVFAQITVTPSDPNWNGPNNGGSQGVQVVLDNNFSDYNCPPPPPVVPVGTCLPPMHVCAGVCVDAWVTCTGPAPEPYTPPPPPPPPVQGPVTESF